MKVSLSWLNDYLSIQLEPAVLADKLTMAGLEVEEITDRFDYLDPILVGRVKTVEPHPNADKLKCCLVDMGLRTVLVICGAPNVAPGILVPVAPPGTSLPNGLSIEKSTIRGLTSEGMICSEAELALGTDASGIMVLSNNPAPGESLKKALGLSDAVLDIDLTPNRPDCLSVIGVAREIAALQQSTLRYPEIGLESSGEEIHRHTSVEIDAPELCPRYTARMIDGITVGPSPFWLQDRILSLGLRPINNIVDITNFVMLEMGQPLHAFDYDRLAGHRIVVRAARQGETFTTLDQNQRRLEPDMLMICDGEKPVAIGGIMGGLNSEIEADTRRVLLESACFNPVSIRRTSKKLGLNTDASHRFERGVDPLGTVDALNRAAELIAKIAGGTIVSGLIDAHPLPPRQQTLALSVKATNRLLGTDLDPGAVSGLLASIGFEVEAQSEDALKVTAPSFRVDVSRPEDLMEEVARLSGYDNIPVTFPNIPAAGRQPAMGWELRKRAQNLMVGYGFSETINYSFISDRTGDWLRFGTQDPRTRYLSILNPLTEDQSVMRTSLIPGLLTTAWHNAAQQNKDLKIFEIGKVFIARGREKLPREIELLSFLWMGGRHGSHWQGNDAPCDFYDVKGIAESLLARLGVATTRYTRAPVDAAPFLKPGHAAEIKVEDRRIGVVGEMHPRVLEKFDLNQPVFVFEADLDPALNSLSDDLKVKPIPRFPATTRDVTVIVDKNLEAATLIEVVGQMDQPLVESVQLFDVFQGAPIEEGKKSISIRLVYRSQTATLEDQAVNDIHKNLCATLLERIDANLPG